MTITWVHSASDNLFDALEAVERGLAQAEATPPAAPQHEDLFIGDSYLADYRQICNLQLCGRRTEL
jgi:hypothetical protein